MYKALFAGNLVAVGTYPITRDTLIGGNVAIIMEAIFIAARLMPSVAQHLAASFRGTPLAVGLASIVLDHRAFAIEVAPTHGVLLPGVKANGYALNSVFKLDFPLEIIQ